ncbi:nucleoside phosphorylase [Agrobacterium vitis]|uniref:nucleoside phosphorylase n=1 Tax=Agrobacterium vitis TaxID=373 RepID=UPI000872EAC3|nr:nucleoside phosphorylase [Agrobacterium vitis]MCE6078272.1 uridine phosphorylase [Agrobacterium vitis]MCM2452751.1 nucleoside phosphorylase [Agrobacterium vitis]MUO73252.1 uridine phosphorylase [Agrobacterium vitis]MUO87382.1 uridine phosphorylase [Agrobacterium vitis]MVA37913.1 uridine phosphorylase [Agrobacterium vitis]
MSEKQLTNRAWYIGAKREEVGKAAILVGDPARIDRIAEHMTDVHFIPENRGLKTITGMRGGERITVSAFGMGAPIATIVMHELHALGIQTFLRIGTAMAVVPAKLGDFVLADGAMRAEGTSNTYAALGFPAIADFELNTELRNRLTASGRSWHAGIFGTYDGFYTEMFALSGQRREMIGKLKEDIKQLGLIGTDMETSALLTAARILGARSSTLCVATVDAETQEKIQDDLMAKLERDMFEIALDVMHTFAAAA